VNIQKFCKHCDGNVSSGHIDCDRPSVPAPSPLAVETAKEWIASAGHNDVMATTEEFVEDLSALLEFVFAQVREEERERCAKIADAHEEQHVQRRCFYDADTMDAQGHAEAARKIAAAIRKGGDHES